MVYFSDIIITYDEEEATLNGVPFFSGGKVDKEGKYHKITPGIKSTPPEIRGIENNGVYTQGVSVEFDERVAYLNGELYNGGKIKEEGDYMLTVKDRAGNITEKEFMIYKSIESIESVISKKPKEKKYYEVAVKLMKENNIEGINIYTHGSRVDFSRYNDVEPMIENGRTLIPVRAVAEGFGANVGWNDKLSLVTISYSDKIIEVQINNYIAKVNGKEVELEVPARIIHGRTILPFRFIAESLGKLVDWYPREGNFSIISVN